MIKVRFAPSPTGFLHIGGARTALFNWMYAKSVQGEFILRIEDTDRQRSKKEYEEEILDSLAWLGLDWDELYYQSRRFDLYRGHAQKLLDEGKAYKEGEAVLLKMIPQGIKVYDLIRGEISFDTSNFVVCDDKGEPVLDKDGKPPLKDEVLIKDDGSPVYNFCCVVDDALMGITHVIRGEDHISNTPRQIVIYQALGVKPPKFAHLPLIMDEGGGRLSKRTGAAAVSDYRKQGFLPEALVNYLMLLGWAPGDNQEMISLAAAIKKFSIKKINKAAAAFSLDKLKWLNSQYIRQADTERLADLIIPFLKEKKYIQEDFDRQKIKNSVDLFKRRMDTLLDFLQRADFVFIDDFQIDPQALEEHLSKNREKEFRLLSERFSKAEPFDAATTEKVFRELVTELGMEASELVHPVRVALTGKDIGPGLFETIVLLGKEKTIERLKKAFKAEKG
ncbi:MAG: glutamate--tRNA ligase [Candidatus Omnitrophica bacterium]|nr:glutamate--tRNA ligase [Candidatus Omnitrophota bacterium]